MHTHYIYITTNLINGKRYLGQRSLPDSCKSIEKDSYIGSGTLLLAAIKKYGRKNFSKEIIAVCDSNKQADELEIKYIKEYQCLENRDVWYNRSPGGQFWRDSGHKEFVSKTMKEFYSNPENKKKYLKSVANYLGFDSYEEFEKNRELKRKIKREQGYERARIYVEKQKEEKRERIANRNKYLKSPEHQKYISELKDRAAVILKNEEVRKKFIENKSKAEINKIIQEGNELYLFLLKNNLFPFNHNINNYYAVTAYKFGRIKNIETIRAQLIKLSVELKDRYGIDLDYEYFTSKYRILITAY